VKYQGSCVAAFLRQEAGEERFDAHRTAFQLTARLAGRHRRHRQFNLPGDAGFDDFGAMLQRTACDRNAGGGVPHRFAFNDAVLRHLIVKQKKAETGPSPMMKEVQREEAKKAAATQPSEAQA